MLQIKQFTHRQDWCRRLCINKLTPAKQCARFQAGKIVELAEITVKRLPVAECGDSECIVRSGSGQLNTSEIYNISRTIVQILSTILAYLALKVNSRIRFK